MADAPKTVAELLTRMEALLGPLEESGDPRRYFLATYSRTTLAFHGEIEEGAFVDDEWVESWDVTFANLYLDALEQWNRDHTAPGPWMAAFQAGR